jgi:hypothetical protein
MSAVKTQLNVPDQDDEGAPTTETTVVNVDFDHECDEHIGRERGGNHRNILTANPLDPGWLGNPFKLREHGGESTLEESLKAYRAVLRTKDENGPHVSVTAQSAPRRPSRLSLCPRTDRHNPREPSVPRGDLELLAEADE